MMVRQQPFVVRLSWALEGEEECKGMQSGSQIMGVEGAERFSGGGGGDGMGEVGRGCAVVGGDARAKDISEGRVGASLVFLSDGFSSWPWSFGAGPGVAFGCPFSASLPVSLMLPPPLPVSFSFSSFSFLLLLFSASFSLLSFSLSISPVFPFPLLFPVLVMMGSAASVFVVLAILRVNTGVSQLSSFSCVLSLLPLSPSSRCLLYFHRISDGGITLFTPALEEGLDRAVGLPFVAYKICVGVPVVRI